MAERAGAGGGGGVVGVGVGVGEHLGGGARADGGGRHLRRWTGWGRRSGEFLEDRRGGGSVAGRRR